jgi:flagellar biosynthesis protein FlhB
MSDRNSRTEKPTPKKRREARQQGKTAKSPELASWASMVAAGWLLPPMVRGAGTRLLQLEAQAMQIASRPDPAGALRILGAGLTDLLYIVVPTALGFMALNTALTVGQVGLRFSFKTVSPKLSRLSPRQGLKRLLSVQGLWEGAKAAIKLALVALVAWRGFSSLLHVLVAAGSADIGPTVSTSAGAVLGLMRSVGLAGLGLAVADYLMQRRRLMSGLLMTKQEIKDEARQAEGDPMLRGRIRQAQRRMSRMRMMSEVTRAHVVAVNPTHYAVAIRYDRDGSGAPRVVAKGTDHVALRIREVAAGAGVPVVEDPPLARALHGACEIDSEIPYHLYLAVARLLAFVYSLPPLAKGGPLRHQTPVGILA